MGGLSNCSKNLLKTFSVGDENINFQRNSWIRRRDAIDALLPGSSLGTELKRGWVLLTTELSVIQETLLLSFHILPNNVTSGKSFSLSSRTK